MMPPIARALDLPRRFFASCRDFGLRFTLYHTVSDWILPAWLVQYGRIVILARPLTAADRDAAADPKVRLATPEDHALLRGDAMPASERAYWAAAIDSGRPVWLLARDGRLVAIYGAFPGWRIGPTWLRHEGRPGDIWGCGIWVAPDQRGRNIANRLRQHVIGRHARAGDARLMGHVEAANRSSIRSMHKVGLAPLGTVSYLRLLGFAVLRAGRAWRCGRCSAARPLTVPVTLYDRTPGLTRPVAAAGRAGGRRESCRGTRCRRTRDSRS